MKWISLEQEQLFPIRVLYRVSLHASWLNLYTIFLELFKRELIPHVDPLFHLQSI